MLVEHCWSILNRDLLGSGGKLHGRHGSSDLLVVGVGGMVVDFGLGCLKKILL
jgi:hypothetical protein